MSEQSIPIKEDDTIEARIACIAQVTKDWVYRHAIPANQYNHLVEEIDALVGQIKEINKIVNSCDDKLFCTCHDRIKEMTNIE